MFLGFSLIKYSCPLLKIPGMGQAEVCGQGAKISQLSRIATARRALKNPPHLGSPGSRISNEPSFLQYCIIDRYRASAFSKSVSLLFQKNSLKTFIAQKRSAFSLIGSPNLRCLSSIFHGGNSPECSAASISRMVFPVSIMRGARSTQMIVRGSFLNSGLEQ